MRSTAVTGVQIERHMLADDGLVPNNPLLPLTVYRAAFKAGSWRGAALNISDFAF